MKGAGDETADVPMWSQGRDSNAFAPALQVICLGNGGGPLEDNVTGLLVRSMASDWARGSLLAIDAGSHLAPIVRILERDFPSVSGRDAAKKQSRSLSPSSPAQEAPPPKDPEPTTLDHGPFAGLRFPKLSARANALHVIRNFVSTYLITHPHLDHLSGFAINTAAFHATSRPKTLAALPSTVEAVKQHIFNDIIWPNLTDEDGGVGFVTFQRLKEGGDVMVGEGEGRGYIDVSDRLGVKAFKVSHGVCTKSPPSHHHRASIHALSDAAPPGYAAAASAAGLLADAASQTQTLQQQGRSLSGFGQPPAPAPGTPGAVGGPPGRQSFFGSSNHASPRLSATSGGAAVDPCVVDSSAFFIREEETNREVLIFGDVEPDSLSLSPRNAVIWAEAARKIALGCLGGVFIECSYDDSQADAVLFGHLNPRHLIAELQTLAAMVVEARESVGKAGEVLGGGSVARKRKRSAPLNGLLVGQTAGNESKRSRSLVGGQEVRKGSLNIEMRAEPKSAPVPSYSSSQPQQQQLPQQNSSSTDDALVSQVQAEHNSEASSAAAAAPDSVSPKTKHPRTASLAETVQSNPQDQGEESTLPPPAPPLQGLKVIIIHVKDTLQDGPHVSERILEQLNDYEERLAEEGRALGCSFIVAESGESYWF